MSVQGLSCIHTSVLTASATKIDFKAFKSSLDVIHHCYIHDVANAVQKIGHKCLLFQVIFYRLVLPGLFFVLFYAPGVEYSSAIKNKTTAIFGFIFWIAVLQIRKAIDFYNERCFCCSLCCFKAFNNFFVGYFQQQLRVYGRAGLPCVSCEQALQEIRLANRSTVFCCVCQK